MKKRRSQILGRSGLSLSRRRGPFFSESEIKHQVTPELPGGSAWAAVLTPGPCSPCSDPAQSGLRGKAWLAGSEEVVLSSPDLRPDFHFQSVL